MSYILVVVGLVPFGQREDGTPTYVVTRRPGSVDLAGFWELPGGKIDPGETAEAALTREMGEELGVEVASAQPLTFSAYRYPEKSVLLLLYEVTLTPDSPAPQALAASDLKFCTAEEIVALDLPPANAPFRALIAERIRS